ncbi:MAG: DNA polymerase I [Firmicutes bacterium]|nr:DNA polymerase I [Bacillota bacterium]
MADTHRARTIQGEDARTGPARSVRQGKLVLIDAYSLIHRAYYALPSLTTSTGEPSNAVYGFTQMLLALLDEEQPEYAAVALDRAGPTFRDELYADYKANRPSMPDDLRPQIARVEQLLDALNLAVYGVEGYEADDILGTLARQGRERGLEVLIVTGDRDCLQLVADGVTVLLTRKGIRDMERLDVQGVVDKLGVLPEQVPDLKGLMGDGSDNIPGVPKVGLKTAVQLLKKYGSLEEVLRQADQIKGRVGENLRAFREQARLSRELSVIRTDAPVTFEPERIRRQPADRERLSALFQELEFKGLLDRLNKMGATLAPAPRQPVRPAAPEAAVQVVRDRESLAAAMDGLRRAAPAGPVAVALAATAEDRMQAGLVGIALAAGRTALYVPVGHQGQRTGAGISWKDAQPVLAPLLEDPNAGKWCHDAKRLRIILRRHGTDLKGLALDLMLASYLINPEQGDHSLPDVSMKFAGRYLASWKQRLSENAGGRRAPDPSELSPEEVGRFLGEELRAVLETGPVLLERLRRDGLWELYAGMEQPLVDVLVEAEMEGVALDTDYLAALSQEMDAQIARLTAEIHELAGEPFNINSPRQLSRILFERLKLPVIKRTKTGPSTDHEVLEALAGEHRVVERLLEFRLVSKLKSTYVDALPSLINPATGRLHTHFNQAVTATGRLSSANPNLQNIPVRTEAGRRIRQAFIPRGPGWVLLKADYSQIELRVLAHMSGDEVLIDAFRRGQDIHVRTASEVFGVKPEQVTGDMRTAAKAINFGIVYGISSYGLARGTGLSQADAQKYIDDYFQRYPGVRRYIDGVVAAAREQGYVTTLFKRRRYLPDLKSRNYARRSFAERTAMNTPIQGTAADIIKLAMVEVQRRLRKEGLRARLLLQVHDELVLEVPGEELEQTAALVRDCMANVVQLSVPLEVDVAAGPNWLDTVPIEKGHGAHA